MSGVEEMGWEDALRIARKEVAHDLEHLTAEFQRGRGSRDALHAELRLAQAEIERLRESNTRLNRRATLAESKAVQNIDDLQRKGMSIGRSLANVGYGIAVRRAEAAEAKVAAALALVEDCPHPWVSEDGKTKRRLGGMCGDCGLIFRALSGDFGEPA